MDVPERIGKQENGSKLPPKIKIANIAQRQLDLHMGLSCFLAGESQHGFGIVYAGHR